MRWYRDCKGQLWNLDKVKTIVKREYCIRFFDSDDKYDEIYCDDIDIEFEKLRSLLYL